MEDLSAQRRAFARDSLGPVFAEFARRLDILTTAFSDQPTVVLYCARGGLRLRNLQALWRRRMKLADTAAHHDFMMSRLLASKLALLRAPQLAIDVLYQEFAAQPLYELARAFLPETQTAALSAEFPESSRTGTTDRQSIRWLFFGDHALARHLRRYADEQIELFDEYLAGLRGGAQRLLLVDSGQFGRTQLLLAAAWPELEWHGAYFARCNYRHEATPHFRHAIGLIVEQDQFSFLIPETAFLRHWHLIEAILEPEIPSVRGLERRSDGRVGSNMDAVVWQDAVSNDGNPFFAGIVDYVQDLEPVDQQYSRARFRQATRALQQAILAPSVAQTALMDMGSRGRDFGRDGYHPVLPHGHARSLLAKWRRVGNALWPEGQLARELAPFGTSLLRQRYRLGRVIDALRFLGRRP